MSASSAHKELNRFCYRKVKSVYRYDSSLLLTQVCSKTRSDRLTAVDNWKLYIEFTLYQDPSCVCPSVPFDTEGGM